MRLFRIPAFIILVTTLSFLHPNFSQAQANSGASENPGVGLMLGEPTGVTVKYWITPQTAFDVGAAWSLAGRNEALHMHSDFLWHSWFDNTENLAFYYGIGARIIFDDNTTTGVRIPIGLNYVFEDIPFDLFVEAAPIIDIAPDTDFAGNGAVGIRFYF